jgi:hypothetical protein
VHETKNGRAVFVAGIKFTLTAYLITSPFTTVAMYDTPASQLSAHDVALVQLSLTTDMDQIQTLIKDG